MGEYPQLLSSQEKALAIRQQSLPSNHADSAACYNSIGLLYENIVDYSKARLFYERAADIAQDSLPSNHPYMQMFRKNLDRIKRKKL